MPTFAPLMTVLRNCLSAVFVASVLLLPLAQANDHGGGPAGPEPLRFTVNVSSENPGGKYLQVEMVFETVHPEAAQAIAALKPKVQHEMILLLSSENAERLRTRDGKNRLVEKIIEAVNKVIDETEKTGVKEVLFTNFIIQ